MFTKKITRHQAKDTGMAMVLICLLIMFVSKRDFLLPSAIALLVLTMTWPAFFKPVTRVWSGISHFIGRIVSRVLLSALFFAVVTPVGLIRRLAGADPLKLKEWRKGAASSFSDRNKTYTAEDLKHPY